MDDLLKPFLIHRVSHEYLNFSSNGILNAYQRRRTAHLRITPERQSLRGIGNAVWSFCSKWKISSSFSLCQNGSNGRPEEEKRLLTSLLGKGRHGLPFLFLLLTLKLLTNEKPVTVSVSAFAVRGVPVSRDTEETRSPRVSLQDCGVAQLHRGKLAGAQ